MKDSIFKNILVNIRAFFTTNVRHRLNENSSRLDRLEDQMEMLNQNVVTQFHYLNLLDYYARHQEEAKPYEKELEYLRQSGKYSSFPYAPSSVAVTAESGFDKASGLPYVMHQNKKLFFTDACTPDKALELYKYYLQVERLLGEGDDEGTPHQYQSPRVHVNDGDVVFDIGAAEGLFALDQVEKASKVVIVESDPQWMEPLKQTFAPYSDKVTILQKRVSATDTKTTISLGTLLSEYAEGPAFVKMDVEGSELQSLASAEAFLKQRNDLKWAVASYHKQHDAEELKTIFERRGLQTEFSNGYMLFYPYDTPVPPFFRHGVIRSKSKEL